MKVNTQEGLKEVFLVKYVNTAITRIAYGTKIIWSLIKSCFGSGFWINTSNWSNIELWKN